LFLNRLWHRLLEAALQKENAAFAESLLPKSLILLFLQCALPTSRYACAE